MIDRLRVLQAHPSAVFLAAQLCALLAYPFVGDSWLGRAVYGLISLVIVALALWAVRRTPALTWVAVLFGAPAMAVTVLEAIWPHNPTIVIISAVLHTGFYLYISYGMLRYVFGDEHVTRDELFATAAAFTVVAWAFGYAYAGVQAAWPGSFGPERSWFELLFLSFTCLTSVGLSDVVPVLLHARSVVIIEEVAGVLYVALVIARLVAMSTARVSRSRKD